MLRQTISDAQAWGGEGGSPWDRMSEEALMLRLRALNPNMKKFIGKVRIEEGFISSAQVSGGTGLVPGTWNFSQHKIAELNFINNVSSTRISRHAAWAFHLEKKKKSVQDKHGHISNFSIPKYFHHSGQLIPDTQIRKYQVVGYRPDSIARIGIVCEVFRGAAVKNPKAKAKAKPKSANTRLMQVSKPVTVELQASMTSRIKVTNLVPHPESGEHCWKASCLGRSDLIDPLNPDRGVFCEFGVIEVLLSYPYVVLRLGPEVQTTLDAFAVRGRTSQIIPNILNIPNHSITPNIPTNSFQERPKQNLAKDTQLIKITHSFHLIPNCSSSFRIT